MSTAVAVLLPKPKYWANEVERRVAPNSSPDDAMAALSILAHDLRGPLANLSLLLESIFEANEHGAMDRVAAYAARADRAIERMEGMLAGMIGRVKAAAGPLAITRHPVDLFTLVDDVARNNLALARRSGVRVHVSGQQSATVLADQDLLSQAVDNLVNNAIRHSPTGGVVRCEVKVDYVTVRLDVRDGGIGLSREATRHLFRPFSSTSDQHGTGTNSVGLGLWIAAAIVERHGGTIEAANRTDGLGAQFTVCLPVAAKRPAQIQE